MDKNRIGGCPGRTSRPDAAKSTAIKGLGQAASLVVVQEAARGALGGAQRARWACNLLGHAASKQRAAVAAMIRTIFAQDTEAEAFAQWDKVADALRDRHDKLGALMDAPREDVLACMDHPKEHWAQIASTKPLERVNKEIKRRADVVGSGRELRSQLPNEEAVIRLVGALMLEQSDEGAVRRRYCSLERLAGLANTDTRKLPAVAAGASSDPS